MEPNNAYWQLLLETKSQIFYSSNISQVLLLCTKPTLVIGRKPKTIIICTACSTEGNDAPFGPINLESGVTAFHRARVRNHTSILDIARYLGDKGVQKRFYHQICSMDLDTPKINEFNISSDSEQASTKRSFRQESLYCILRIL